MLSIRIIPVLHCKGNRLVKGVHLEGLRVLGDPEVFTRKYYADGADEIILIDTVASLYGRNSLLDVLRRATEDVFIPVTVGGGVRSVEDARRLLDCGAEKVAVNTAAHARPKLLKELSDAFGRQAIVLYVEARSGECMTDNGREATGRAVGDWIQEAASLGAGEVLLSSVDGDGTGQGFDVGMVSNLRAIAVPVIVHGGAGRPEHFVDAWKAGADAIAASSIFHYHEPPEIHPGEGVTVFMEGGRNQLNTVKPCSIATIKRCMAEQGALVRNAF